MTTCWQILELQPTQDLREIKRAYARLLKLTRPEEDAAGFQLLRDAFEQAQVLAMTPVQTGGELHAAGPGEVCPHCGKVHEPLGDATEEEKPIVAVVRPWIDEMSLLNRDDATVPLAIAKLRFYMAEDYLKVTLHREIFEDGVLYLCCDDKQIHDNFVRVAVDLFRWLQPDNWMAERDPQTVQYLQLRLSEADALDRIERLMGLIEAGDEASALTLFDETFAGDMLFNVDVRTLFEGELMVALSEFRPLPLKFVRHAGRRLGWDRDHRHLQSYHPEAWQVLQHGMHILDR